MGVRAARDGFSKDEVLEILKRNVSLYKNEPEFVDYIVNLALFLIDQRLQAGGATPPSGELLSGRVQMSAEDFDDLPGAPVPPVLPSPPVRSSQVAAVPPPLFPERDSAPQKPPSMAERRSQQQGAPAPPPAAGPPPWSPAATGLPTGMAPSFKSSELSKEPSAPPPGVLPSNLPPSGRNPSAPIPTLRQLSSSGAMTPLPDDVIRPGPKIEMGDQGRTRIYKVVRSYSANEGEKMYCPICGTETGGESKCPNCGHLV